LKTLKILGIYRNPRFSNNAIEADRLILEQGIAQLARHLPVQVEMIEEEESLAARGEYSLVLTMAQSEGALAAIERNFGASPIWNSPAAIRNCYRKTMSRILGELDVGYVPYRLLSTAEAARALPQLEPGQPYWLKRSDFHAISDEDVTLAETAGEMLQKLEKFQERGVREVIVQRHIHGDIYKFYGVRGKFFRAIRVRSFLPPGAPQPDLAQLERNAFRSAEALGLVIFGGDAILDAQGRFHFIDVNDWPSFRICREESAAAIGSLAAGFLEATASGRTLAAGAAAHA